ncbi:ATP-dependent helicase HrpB [Reyranella sp. CPCC 100927]|uniref:ATP-dependent helicase HrpB n=1 Tax=Reyranella sp. CPCC 100927 TaxID=2599616 RepID=UPI0011B73015|nr:ATP-dependent helicase HrpB [Reyranella sp. CPCC 100927]TWT02058.1 ATP-dependent helicase HrpB [Reyranella sp. CPCC 100927]
MDALPIEEALPALKQALLSRTEAVLLAPPGAGKTTRVPLALLDAPWLAGRKIIMQEPRRIAARAAARRMAQTLGEAVGDTVGYRVRLDSRVGPATRIEVVTDGLFLRRLQADPTLEGIGCVIFDELHERGLETDLSLALVREAQLALRDDLRVLAMSATLDGVAVAQVLGGAPIIESAGRMFPVDTRYLERDADGRIEDVTAAAVRRAVAEEPGSALVFLPGVGEIRRVEERLRGALPADTDLVPLYGDLAPGEQDRAIRPAPAGRRKVVLATSIAETSLTIDGVRIVVDAGWMRVPRFSPRTGMERLQTVRVTQASADQRRGRAGRLAPGVCYRLWSEATQRGLRPFGVPEILDADLAPLALELAAWGTRDVTALPWLTPPPVAALATARDLLRDLGALDDDGAVTAHGRAMSALGQHPRLAHLLLRGQDEGRGALACQVAALIAARDLLRFPPGQRDPDLRHRVDVSLNETRPVSGAAVDRGTLAAVRQSARDLRRRLGVRENGAVDSRDTGRLVAMAYPDRVARRRPGGGARYRLSGGRGATLPEGDPLAAEEWLAVADLDEGAQDARIFLAAPLALADIEDLFDHRLVARDVLRWDGREQAVVARRERRLGTLVLEERALPDPASEAVRAAMLDGLRALGLDSLPWSDGLRSWQQRVQFLRRHLGEEWPDVSDPALLASLSTWLGPYLDGVSRRAHLDRVDLASALHGTLEWSKRQKLDELAPTHIAVPSGSRVAVDYTNPDEPVLAVRLQEMFGLAATPRIAGGRVPLLIHLLSPARRPVQVTRDLASFWASGYRAVKAELKGRYPRHYWPDDPLVAEPTARVRPRPK